jgi:hypothetical protein
MDANLKGKHTGVLDARQLHGCSPDVLIDIRKILQQGEYRERRKDVFAIYDQE